MEKYELMITAQQAMLELREQETEELAAEVEVMLEHLAVMDEVQVDELEPTTHALSPKDAALREDEPVSDPRRRSLLLEQAPKLDGSAISLPKVLV